MRSKSLSKMPFLAPYENVKTWNGWLSQGHNITMS